MDLLSLTLGALLGFGFGVLAVLLCSKATPMTVTLNQPTTQDVHYHCYPKPTMEILDEDGEMGEDEGDEDDWRKTGNH
jgi:hypothetical protein